MKKTGLITIFSLLFFQTVMQGQIVGADAYMQGVNMEIGVKGVGGFEGVDAIVSPPPVGMHLRSSNNLFGIVGNPQKNAWTTFDGDFFTPGSPENGWGFEIGTASGVQQGNNCSWLQEINGSITSYSNVGGYISVNWEGDCTTGTDLHFIINYKLQDTALFYTTTVSIINNTSATIPDMYYYKNIDADNNQEIGFDFTTQNTIVSQPSGGGTTAFVTSSSMVPWYSHLSLIGLGADWRASYGGFSNRDGSNIWNGIGVTQTVGATNFADEAMSLAFRIQNFLPGTTRTFQYLTVIDTNSIPDALMSTLFLDFVGEDNGSSAITDTIRICGTDSAAITVNGPTASDYNWTWSPSYGLSDSTGISVLAYPMAQTTYTVVGTPISGIGSNDTINIVVVSYPSVSLSATLSSLGFLCSNSPPFALTGGMPAGGIYTGIGVVGGTIYDPSSVPTGTHIITYTISDSVGCFASDTATITVDQINVNLLNIGYFCGTALPFLLTEGSPYGGVYSGPGVVNDSIYDPSAVAPGFNYPVYYTYADSLGCSASDTANIYIADCTGIGSNYMNNLISVYPNPFSSDAVFVIGSSIQLKNAALHIYDVLGKEVMSVLEIQDHEFKIERNKLFSGMYIYKLENDSQVIGTGKLMVR